MSEEILLTQEGYDKIVEEHEQLISVRRVEVAQHLKEAKSYGDLSENAEYDAAKDEQVEVEERIAKLEAMIRNAKIVSEDDLAGDRVNLGLKVVVRNMETKKDFTYTIVGITDADPLNGKISNESPLGKALLGKKVNEKVEIPTAKGAISYQLKKIIKD